LTINENSKSLNQPTFLHPAAPTPPMMQENSKLMRDEDHDDLAYLNI
jgi:hypothetical protein